MAQSRGGDGPPEWLGAASRAGAAGVRLSRAVLGEKSRRRPRGPRGIACRRDDRASRDGEWRLTKDGRAVDRRQSERDSGRADRGVVQDAALGRIVPGVGRRRRVGASAGVMAREACAGCRILADRRRRVRDRGEQELRENQESEDRGETRRFEKRRYADLPHSRHSDFRG